MTSSINTFNFPKNMNLTIIKNSSKLSSYEQKNLAILILVRYKLAFFVKQNPNDEFINKLYTWLENNVMNFRDIEIAFTTDKVEETVQSAVNAGAKITEIPKTKPWGQVVAYIRDLDGFLIEICTPIS